MNIPSKYDEAFAKGRVHKAIERLELNLDTKWCEKVFMEVFESFDDATAKTGFDTHQYFLSLFIPKLAEQQTLPSVLVQLMIYHYGWPNSLDEIDNSPQLGVPTKELLKRFCEQQKITEDSQELVGEQVASRVVRHRVMQGIGLVIIVIVIIAAKVLFKSS